MHGSYGGFEYAAWEARRELLEEAQRWRLARLARPGRGLRERLGPALRRVAGWLRPGGAAGGEEIPVGEVPDIAYLTPGASGEAGVAVEVYLGRSGCVVRKTDLGTGTSTDAFVADAPVRP